MFQRMLVVVDWWLHDVREDAGMVTTHQAVIDALLALQRALKKAVD